MAKSIIANDNLYICFICHKRGQTEVHHMIHGTWGRPIAEKYGLTVHLCRECHGRLHDHGDYDNYLKQLAQKEYERIRSNELTELAAQAYVRAVEDAKDDAHKEWMLKVRKNYLED